MNSYKIEWKIITIAIPILYNEKGGLKSYNFEIDGIKFSPWEENIHERGYNINSWIASSDIEGDNHVQAYSKFTEKLSNLISKISFVSQCYIEYLTQPFIIHKLGSDLALFRESEEAKPVGLIFNEKQVKALEILYKDNTISSKFYYYWNDAINTFGYSGKLLLMFSALEALANEIVRQKKNIGRRQKKKEIIKDILGEDLFKYCFEKTIGLRNRLVHGEYYQATDFDQNYVEIIHQKVINYFNQNIFKETLIEENITNPQRHIWRGGENLAAPYFIKDKENSQDFSLKKVLEELKNGDFFENSQKYEYIHLTEEEREKY
jgi:hypothetical protein